MGCSQVSIKATILLLDKFTGEPRTDREPDKDAVARARNNLQGGRQHVYADPF